MYGGLADGVRREYSRSVYVRTVYGGYSRYSTSASVTPLARYCTVYKYRTASTSGTTYLRYY